MTPRRIHIPGFILAILMVLSGVINAQKGGMGINESAPHPSAILHMSDDDRMGFKIPYTDSNAVNAFANSFTPPVPIANGLLIFQKGAETFYYYDAPLNMWVPLHGIAGPTGPKGDTGLAGPTGPSNVSSTFRHGIGPPAILPGDTCNHMYLDLQNASVYRFLCPFNIWSRRGGPYLNKIRGGETTNKTTIAQVRRVMPATGTNFDTIWNLMDTVQVPPGKEAYILVKANGTVQKASPNNDYNYAKFRFAFNGVAQPNTEQVVSMGPSGKGFNKINDNVMWSISHAGTFVSTTVISVQGGQAFSRASNGSIIIAGRKGSPNVAHLEIMVIYADP